MIIANGNHQRAIPRAQGWPEWEGRKERTDERRIRAGPHARGHHPAVRGALQCRGRGRGGGAVRGGRRDGLPARADHGGPCRDPRTVASVLAHAPQFTPEEPLPTLICGDIALTSTAPKDEAGA